MRLLIESCVWVLVVVLAVALRTVSRWLSKRSLRGLNPDDYFMLFLTLTYTSVVVTLNHLAYKEHVISQEGQTTEVQILVGKLWTAVELLMMFTVWGVKICMLLLYSRITELLPENIAVRATAVYVVCTYFVVLIVFCTTLCKPFNTFWAPLAEQPPSCYIWTKYYIVHYTFNASSDLMIICIPITIVVRAHFNLARKLLLIGVFGIGALTIVAATLNKYYNFVAPASSGVFIPWYIREDSMAMLVANILLCRPALKKMFSWHIFQEWPRTFKETERDLVSLTATSPSRTTNTGGEKDESFNPMTDTRCVFMSVPGSLQQECEQISGSIPTLEWRRKGSSRSERLQNRRFSLA
ncbi:hypothetical protein BP6252_05866 [Coleophoma cylindrospora]|uniref:Rhodopsin domain-containing protein n=1 Tax=Coleophoma cylindrospora TaxID=1849047 RepID=A0A3D8RUT4_9HELO|nr:hypothetical protein BP6252_05866 [Coleophoma cylindrospora]